MPIETNIPFTPISQSAFGRTAYEVVGHAFTVHKQLGRMFDESVYRKTVAHLLAPRAAEEVCIQLTHRGYQKRLFIDLVVDSQCPFELKVVSEFHQRHRAQLIQYLMLTDLHHGKLINFGTERVEHEFVNCLETTEHRRIFQVDLDQWKSPTGEAREFQEIIVDLIRDWGTGLDRALYIDALTHLLGGLETVQRPVETLWNGKVIGWQNVNFAARRTGFDITCLRRDIDAYEAHLVRLLANTSLDTFFWVNVVSGNVRLVLLQ